MILVLNSDYLPLNVSSFKRAYKLVFKGKAEIIASDESNPIIGSEKNYDRPTIIRLTTYVKFPYKKVPLTRQTVFKRDNHVCLYCGSKKELTLDHVMPKSRGGLNSWENLATCCSPCNRRKDDRTPEEAGMKLSHKPYSPSYISLLLKSHNMREDWRPYIFYNSK